MQPNDQHPAERSTTGDIARRAGVNVEAVQRVFAAILDETDLGRVVVIEGFGNFRVGETGKRTVRTPIVPGGVAHHRPRRCLRFRQAKGASRKLNGEST